MQLTFTTPQSFDQVKYFEVMNDLVTFLSQKDISCGIVADLFQSCDHIVVHIDHADTADCGITDNAEKSDNDCKTGKSKDEEWLLGAAQNLASAYGPDEPEYEVSMLREVNPDYGSQVPHAWPGNGHQESSNGAKIDFSVRQSCRYPSYLHMQAIS